MQETGRSILQVRYRGAFLACLLAASFLPAIVSVLNFEIANQSVLPFMIAFAVVVTLGNTHVWMTVSYYFDERWLAHFREHRLAFFVVPGAILAGSILVAVQPERVIWEVFGYGIIFANLWHHSNQNWGIMAMVGKLRGIDPGDLRAPLVWAWPFFILAACIRFPVFREAFQPEVLTFAARASAVLYFAGAMAWLARSRLWKSGDPVSILFALAFCTWFMPMAILSDKPYYLAIWVGAHALQYYLFVLVSLGLRDRLSFPAGGAARTVRRVALTLAGLTALAFVLGDFVDKSTVPDSIAVRLVAGIIAGINIGHFWLDALIWKFANPRLRSLHGAAYSF